MSRFASRVPFRKVGRSGERMPTLLMMHGMTGTADMMRPFAEAILPEGGPARARRSVPSSSSWICVVAVRGLERFTDPTRQPEPHGIVRRGCLLGAAGAGGCAARPAGPLVVGGFSMGGAMAQEMLHLPLADRIIGVIALGTRLIRPMELRLRLEELERSISSGCTGSVTCVSRSRTDGRLHIYSKTQVGPPN